MEIKGSTIKISNETISKLKKLKLTKLDTYDEIINRLLKEGSEK